MRPFVLINSDHGAMIINRLDYNKSFNDTEYGVGSQIMNSGAYDPGDVDTIKQLLTLRRNVYGDGVIALDCGANIGVHTVEWARHMDGWGHVVAIEAQERIFYALAGNLTLHNRFNARAIWAAVSDHDGHIDIPEPDYCVPSSFGSFELRQRLGTENIGQAIDYAKPKIRVRTTKIDTAGFDRLDLFKIDIEGMELEALAGATETIKACKPILYVERIKVDQRKLSQTLAGFDYVEFPHGMNVLGIHKSDPCIEAIKVEKAA